MKTPISYYGGKQNLIDELLPMIPRHVQYVEPFCGGASLFWAKKPSQHEVINDYDYRVANFWQVLQSDFDALQAKIQNTLHHESAHQEARRILREGESGRVDLAWAFWVQTQMSFSNKMFGGFAFCNAGRSPLNTKNKRESFTDQFYQRIKLAEIFNRDAIDLIKLKDTPDTFFYLDPPYAESDCGHYDNLKEVYYRLLELLPSLKGKWLMSSYPSEELSQLRAQNGLHSRDIQQNLGVAPKHTTGKTKVECLTWNYQLEGQTLKLFA